MGEKSSAYTYRGFVGKLEGKRLVGKPGRGWEGNIKKDLREIGWGDLDWIHLAQDRDQWWGHVNTVMNLRVSYNRIGNT
jgi:hypothetical protein